jgi:hypothetical protein
VNDSPTPNSAGSPPSSSQPSDAIDPRIDFDLSADARGRLVLIDAAGARHEDVAPVRAFPITDPTRWLAICDAHGAELAFCDDMRRLPDRVRELVEAELARRAFVPVIRSISRISTTVEPTQWDVTTDRGATTFTLESEEHVRRVGRHQATVTDSHGMRYLIPDIRALDSVSRRWLDRYL